MLGLNVIIVCTEIKTAETLEEIFHRLGCAVTGRILEDANALNIIKAIQPGLVVVEGIPAFMDLAKTIRKNNLVPIILFADKDCPKFIAQNRNKWGVAFLDKLADETKWKSAIKVTMDQFHKVMELDSRYQQVHSAHTTRKIVDQARQLLMENWQIGEVQALYTIQILAHNQGTPIREMAEKIISAHQSNQETA
ncbi:ANTAR domain-containing response regulator [Candidatus Formimonas warabiya]|uniref:ANTAR domain-containing protein n=1 Tax=Formimonas warabiya TaxID=1761012 RepID=A0A3G1KX23_FORW1|nr:ANTAR domain-containing protein [Candidatus Formimonas warabiya]ATW27083.1 hypothetical protein DCMF_22080 [Candidatus Formimonas warabiya]